MGVMDAFWSYGSGDLDAETQDDLMCLLMQKKGTMYYYRSYGGNVPAYENKPQSLSTAVALPFDVASAIADRNRLVSNGQSGYPDRRVFVSQKTVTIDTSVRGVTKVVVRYIPAADLRSVKTISAPLGAQS